MSSQPADRIKLACSCGKRLAVPPDWAGRRVRCPKCRQPLNVPASETPAGEDVADDLFPSLSQGEEIIRVAPPEPVEKTAASAFEAAQGDGKTCPSCGKSWTSRAKICVNCGIDLKTGRAIEMHDDEHLDSAYVTAENLISVLSWLFPIGIYPVASEAFGLRKPWVIRAVALATIAISVWYWFAPDTYANRQLMQWDGSEEARAALIERAREEAESEGATLEEIEALAAEIMSEERGEFRWYQPLTCAFLHGDILHLAGNLLFLMVLGSRINMLSGNLMMLAIYPLLGFASGLIEHVAEADGPLRPALGASGVIMGLAGMYLVLFPATKVHMAAWFRWGLIRGFSLSMSIFPVRGFWVVSFYIAFDVLAIYLGSADGVGHWAHLGGFLSGVGLGLILLFSRLVDARGGDLLSVVLGKKAWLLIGKPNAKRLSLW
ncbi:MAG: rhomboid family intramembrane serine protease [Planctomycetes bacterium]|nr:rhomboid family intramembrane serine protease [Planctomycetota bacterium]